MGHRAYTPPRLLAAKLLTIRESLGLSQVQMARRIDFHGHYARISEFEKGRRTPSILMLLAYARAASIPLESLIDDQMDLPV